jgi:hypothetical protein
MGDLKDLPGFTATPTSEQRPADAVYRPMAVLAIIGFAVSCLYAGFLLLCLLVALFTHSTPLLANVSLLLPLTGVGLSLAGWIQVRRAEGTLAGDRLAAWGTGVGAVGGLVYVAYAAASYVAVRQQAEAVAQQFLGLIRKQDYARAFLLTERPEQRPPDGPDLRQELEIRFNNPGRSGKGDFSTFRQELFCQLLARGGGESKIESLGVKEWLAQGNGYRVTLGYRVTTPEAACDLEVMVLAAEGHKRGGRQWWVKKEGTGVRNGYQPTPLGVRLGELQGQAMPLAQGWFRDLSTARYPAAYLATLEPSRRERLVAEVQARAAMADLAALPGLEVGGPDLAPGQLAGLFLPGYRQFLKGDWLRDDPQTFWARDDQTRTEFAEALRKALRDGKPLPFRWEDLTATGWTKADGRLQFSYECSLALHDEQQGPPRYIGESRLILQTDASALEPTSAAPLPPAPTSSGKAGPWQVVRLELLRAGSPPAPGPNVGAHGGLPPPQ